MLRIPHVIQAGLGHIRGLGWVDGPLLLLDRGLRRMTGDRARLIKYRLVAQPVPDQSWLPTGRGSRIEVRPLGPDDTALAEFPRSPDVYRFRFEQGAQCLGAFRNGEPVGFIWFTLGDYDEDEVRCTFSPQPQGVTAWDFDVYVVPKHRIGPVFLRLWDAVNHYLRERGIRWTLSRISAFNQGSMTAHERLGAMMLGWLSFLCIGPVQLMVGSVRPWLHLDLNRRSMPVVVLPVENLSHASSNRHPSPTPGR